MKIASETAMLELGQKIASKLKLPAIIELVGDVGAGKTTFTRGLAQGLDISEPITSPSFTISKRYPFPLQQEKCCKNYNTSAKHGELIHYDFYRLSDPGIMSDELAETLQDQNSIVVIEWGGDVANLLPENHLRLHITLNSDGSRSITTNQPEIMDNLS